MENTKITPYEPTVTGIIFKILSGLFGGIFGSLVIAAIFFLSSSILQPAFQPDVIQGKVHSLFVFIFMAMIFLSVTVSSIVVSLLSAVSERGKYQRLNSALYQIFIVNIIIFVFIAPLYVILAQINLSLVGYIAAFHVILSGLAGVMILEIVGNPSYALLGVYSTVFGLLAGVGLILVIFQITNEASTILLFSTLPILWFSLGVASAFVELIYKAIYGLYGVDFLRTDLQYGMDVVGGAEDEPSGEELADRLADDEEDIKGKDFLEKK